MKRIKIDRVTRTALIAGAIVIGLIVSLVARTVMSIGVFNSFPEQTAGVCKPITGMKGPEDIEVDADNNLIFVSAFNRRAPSSSPDPQDGIYTLKLDDTSAPPVKLEGTPKDFHPHGISLYRGQEGYRALFVINHKSTGKQAVEVFEVTMENGAAKLTHQSSIESGLLVSPNDIYAYGPEQFYITNDHTSTSALGRWLDDYLQYPRANLVNYDGTVFKVSVERLNFPNGVLLSPDSKYVYVTSTTKRELLVFERDQFTSQLKQAEGLSIPARLDNISMDSLGNLWIAGHPKLPAYVGYPTDPSKPSPSAVFRVIMLNGLPQRYETVYANNGEQLGGSSSAVSYKNRLLIGSVLDNKILDCTTK